ncbi:unnamed protein product [Mytilus edulis]|uniref:Apple domain-containing protein n=1 Tax=Mytilus edulis TaxID=6550 RepID=A0A8S3SXA7_MYTED|nr:unnamed protein product [Mytilus edulis]
MTVWTIHKVNNETPKGTRSYENLPYTIEYNLDDHESVLCVYFVYEGLKFSGWVADDCKNETVVHLVLCTDKSYGITDLKLFVEMSSVIIVNKVSLKNISVSSTVECEEQCIALTTYSINCAGFNYNWKLQECALLAYLEDCKCSSFILSETEGMSAFLVKPYSIRVIEYNPITIDIPRGSPELRIQDNDDTDSTVTDSQASTLVERATTTKPSSTAGDNAAASTLVERATTKPSSTVGDSYAATTGSFKPIHKHGSTEIRIQDNDNKDLMVTSQQSITGGYKTINKPGSTELGIEDNDNTDPMVTDQQRMFQFFFGISFTFCIV